MSQDKLTLSVDRKTKQVAKRLAEEDNVSVSKLFATLINELDAEKRKNDPILEKIRRTAIPDWIKQLTLTDKPTPDFDHKAEYGKHLEEKYGI
ncbi:DUF6364 family protein [Mucilaginibacter puniceus]